MKRYLFFVLLLVGSWATAQEMYVGLHYITVKSEDAQGLIELEKNYFSKLHKAAIDRGEKIGWDMWQITNSSDASHTTFVYAHLQPSLDTSNMGGDNSGQDFSEKELQMARQQWGGKVVAAKFVMTAFKGGFVPAAGEKPATIAVVSHMEVDPTRMYEYEQMELKNFMPAFKNNPLVKGWGLHKILEPLAEGSPNYITANFFNDMSAVYKNSENTGRPTRQQQSNYSNILKLRKMSRVDVMRLVLAER